LQQPVQPVYLTIAAASPVSIPSHCSSQSSLYTFPLQKPVQSLYLPTEAFQSTVDQQTIASRVPIDNCKSFIAPNSLPSLNYSCRPHFYSVRNMPDSDLFKITQKRSRVHY
jgi:hypothetical protein